jgi:hypothetical protein
MSEHLNKNMKKIITLLAILAFISPALASAAPFIVDQGGTGAQTLPAGQLLVGNGKSPVSATSSPTVDSINTSSTTATSTFSGNAYIKGNLRVDGNFYAPVSLVSSGNATINGVLTVTGVTQFADGAVGTPSVTFTADTNTGMYRGGNDILRFVTAGADRLTINASGNVGIGTTSPSQLLQVGTTMYVNDSAKTLTVGTGGYGGATSGLILPSTGAYNLGIYNSGNTFDVRGGLTHSTIFSVGSSGNLTLTGALQTTNIVIPSSASAGISLGSSNGAYAHGIVSKDNQIQFTGNGNSTVYWYANANGGHTNQTGSATAMNFVAASSTLFSTFAGNVGIGTTGPTQKLEVNGGIRQNTATSKPTCDSTVRGTTWFFQGGAGVKDTYEVCAKDAGDAYAWRTIY